MPVRAIVEEAIEELAETVARLTEVEIDSADRPGADLALRAIGIAKWRRVRLWKASRGRDDPVDTDLWAHCGA